MRGGPKDKKMDFLGIKQWLQSEERENTFAKKGWFGDSKGIGNKTPPLSPFWPASFGERLAPEVGSQGGHFVPSLTLAARPTASGSAPLHLAGPSPRGRRTKPRRPQAEAAAADCGDRPGHCGGPPPASFLTARESSGAAAHRLASLALPRAATWGPAICTRMERCVGFLDKAFLASRLAGFRPLFIVVPS